MTTPSSSSSLSHALNPPTVAQKPQTELPRLQLAPPEHQRHLQTQAQAKQQQETIQQAPSISPVQRRPDDYAASPPSSREVSPALGVVNIQPTSAEKRKASGSRTSSSKKRRTDQVVEEDSHNVPLQYGFGTHYPYAYAYPGAPPPPPPPPTSHPTSPTSSSSEMGFNEFQWRLLNLCGEFYEAATELIRGTPHLVLSQAFQLLSRGTGVDPIGVLNDARRTCDLLLANPQSLATAPPLPSALPLSVLSSLAHLNSRASASAAPAPSVPPPSYYPSLAQNTSGDKANQKGKEKERQPNNVQGTWKEHEVQKLKMLAEKYRVRDKTAVAQEEEEEEEEVEDGEGILEGEGTMQSSKKTQELGDIDWDKVVAEFGDERSRHQVLIKATYLGLKPSSTLPGKKPKKKKPSVTSTEPPLPTFSSASVRSIPVGYPGSQLGPTQSSSTSPEGPTMAVTAPPPPSDASTSNNASTDSHKLPAPVSAPVPLPAPQPQHTPVNPHVQYSQTGWYPHPQNPYYAYHQPMYYSTHPPGYGLQSYVHSPPQQGYYGQPYAPVPGTDSQQVEKPSLEKGKRKDIRKSNGEVSTSMASLTPIPPPSLPPRAPINSSSVKPSTTVGAPSSTDAQGSAGSTPRIGSAVPPGSTGATPTSSSGVLRRGPNNSLFTYTPLPHGGTSTEQNK